MSETFSKMCSIAAWLKTFAISLPVCAGTLAAYLVLFGNSADRSGLFIIIGISAVVHAIALAVVGIPFFLYFWPTPNFPVWRIPIGTITGFILGYLAMFLTAVILASTSQANVDWGYVSGSIVGGVYGALTGFVATVVNKRFIGKK